MATYLPQVTDYIPQFQPFVPEYNFYADTLQMKQSKYDAARQQLSTMYGSLLNAPLTRDDNANTRDQFFKAIEQDIQRMSGVDLSLNQNFEAAQGVFDQLLDNKYIVKDMVWTKGLHNQYKRAEGFRNCTDPDKCGGSWWEGGERLLSYAVQDFKMASPDEAMNMGNVRFIPYQDITKRAIALAKEADLNISVDQITGQWITTTKNGPAITAPLQQLLMGSIAQDPKVMEYYQAKAEVDRRDFMYSNKGVYGSEAAAEQAYINNVMPTLNQWLNATPAATEDKINAIENKKKYLEDKAKDALPYKKNKLEALYQQFTNLQGGLQQTLNYITDVAGELQVAQNNQRYTGGQIDRMMAALNLGTDINKLATTLSYRNYEFKIKENPYAMEATRFRNSMLLEKARSQNEMEKMYYKAQLDALFGTGGGSGKSMWGMFGDPASNTPSKVDVPGATTIGSTDTESEEYKERAHQKGFLEPRESLATDISSNERQMIKLTLETAQAEADAGNQQAKEDYIAIARNIALTQGTYEKRVIQEGEEVPGSRPVGSGFVKTWKRMKDNFSSESFIRNSENLSTEEQYNLAKKYLGGLPLQDIGSTRIAAVYANLATDIMDPNRADAVMREYLQPVIYYTSNFRSNIQLKNQVLDIMDAWHADKIKQVADYARQTSGDMVADAIEAYYDDQGYIVDKETFLQNMVNKKPEYGYENNYRYLEAMYEGKSIELGRGEYISDKGGVESSNAVYAGDVLADFGETALGILANVGTVGLGYLLGGGSKWVGDWNPEVQKVKSVSDAFQEAFTGAYLRFKDQPGWAGLMGAGDEVAYGQNFKNVDVASPRSIGTMGFLSYMKDALANGETRFDLGYFKQWLPENDEKAKELMNVIFNDFKGMYKEDNRPLLDITYSDIAGSDESMVGLNIKLNQDYLKKYAGTKDDPGLMREYMEILQTQGITAYMPRKATQNLFTLGMQKSILEQLMDMTGEIKFDSYPEYFKNFAIKYDPSVGGYIASGMWRNGLDENGNPNWDFHQANYTIDTDINNLVQEYNKMIQATIRGNNTFEQIYLANMKQNNQQYGR